MRPPGLVKKKFCRTLFKMNQFRTKIYEFGVSTVLMSRKFTDSRWSPKPQVSLVSFEPTAVSQTQKISKTIQNASVSPFGATYPGHLVGLPMPKQGKKSCRLDLNQDSFSSSACSSSFACYKQPCLQHRNPYIN